MLELKLHMKFDRVSAKPDVVRWIGLVSESQLEAKPPGVELNRPLDVARAENRVGIFEHAGSQISLRLGPAVTPPGERHEHNGLKPLRCHFQLASKLCPALGGVDPSAAKRALEFVETWVSEHIDPEEIPSQVDVLESCRAAANSAGISDAEIGEQFDSLATFIAGQIEGAADKLSAKDD